MLYNKINIKEFCSCCIFNQYLTFQGQIISRASRCNYVCCHSWTLPNLPFFCVLASYSASQHQFCLDDLRNVFLAWDAIECMFILVCWSSWELSCPQFLILVFIWLLQLLWLWRPGWSWSSVLESLDDSAREKDKITCFIAILVLLFDPRGWFIEATLQSSRKLCIISCKFGPVVLEVGELYKLFFFWMLRERAGEKEGVWVINWETCLLVWEMFEASNLIESDEKAGVLSQMCECWILMFILCYSF